MMYLIQGRPRSGKSYEAVKYHVVPAIKKGRKVVTNLPLNVDEFKKRFDHGVEELIEVVKFDYTNFDRSGAAIPFSQPEHFESDWRNDDGNAPLIVIDEAHFPLGKGSCKEPVKNFLTMHGHYGYDILLMTQHSRQLDRDVLNLVEVTYKCTKNTALGSSSTYTKKVIDGHRGAVVNTEQRTYDKTIFPLYTSHTQSKKAVLEKEAGDIKPIWKHWSVYGAVACFAFVVFMLVTADNVNPLAAPESDLESRPLEASNDNGRPSTEAQRASVPGSPVSSMVSRSRREAPEFPEHPFYRVDLHVAGYMDVSSSNGTSSRRVGFMASRNGTPMFNLSMRDLLLAGYSVSIITPCSVVVEFGDTYRDYLTCDVPTEESRGVLDAF